MRLPISKLVAAPAFTPMIALVVACSLIPTAAAQQKLRLDPAKGYTQKQALALFPKFDKKTWNLDTHSSQLAFGSAQIFSSARKIPAAVSSSGRFHSAP